MIIVTGGASFTGSNIVRSLNDKGITDILVVNNLKDGIKFVNLVDPNIVDYMDKENLLVRAMTGESFSDIEAVFHEGTYPSTTEWSGKYMMSSNYQYSKELLHYRLEREIPSLYTPSAATYDGHTSDFIEPREYKKLLNVYDYSKFLSDEYVRQILSEANSRVVGSYYFNAYGPREGHKGSTASVAFHPNIQPNSGETPELFEDSGNFKRDFVYVGGVAAVNLWFLENGVLSIFNLDAGRTESPQAVADATLAYHKKGSIEYTPFLGRLKGHYQIFTQADLTNPRAAGYDKPFKTVAGGVAGYMAWLNRDA